jgi:hypothetical protein
MCFFALWIPFGTLFIGMIGMPSGDYDWVELPILSRYSILAVGIFFFATFFFLFGASIVSWYINRSIRAQGILAEAEVINLQDTGTTINNNPVVRLYLEVRPKNAPVFEAEAEQLVSRLDIPRYQPGSTIKVWYDPDNQEVALADPDNSLQPS